MSNSPRWPAVIGTLGIVLGVVLLLDKIDDVLTLSWTAQDWGRIFAPDLADLIARSMPPVAWRVFSAAVQIALAALLIGGSVALRRRARSGVRLCRLWAWLAVVWIVVSMGRSVWWLQQHGGELPASPSIVWGFAVMGIAFATVLLLAFPVFLLVWLSRPAVRGEYATWPAETA
jgi:hypothetical protein